jgi:RimJ/RimL family protein N-acetyltransferase
VCWQTPSREELVAAGLSDLPEDIVDVDILIGEPDLLGHGVGPAALGQLITRLRAEGVHIVGLGVATGNQRALEAYDKAGFRPFRDFHEGGQEMRYLVQTLNDAAMNAPEDRTGTIARYREGPHLLDKVVMGLTDADLDAKPSQGGWTIRQIIHHIADGDDIWKMCIKMAMGNEEGEFALGWYGALPQETWADRWAYAKRSVDVSLTLFRADRAHVVQLLECVPEVWHRSVVVRTAKGDVERVPVGFVVQMQADHVFHHIERIRAILRERLGT